MPPLSDERVRRFTRFQVALHWGLALLYLTLLLSGGAILFQRLLGAGAGGAGVLSAAHKTAGIGLILFLGIMLVAILLAGRLRSVGGDILECLRWRSADIVWLVKFPLHVLWARVRLPPTGRFNAAQKLYGVFTVLGTPVFLVTGALMMVRPGILGLWIVHAGLFLPAVMLQAGHLFFALLNPSTRGALRGILTGYVSRRYATEHHPLWLEECGEAPDHGQWKYGRMVSWGAVGAALLLVVLAGAAGAVAAGRSGAFQGRWDRYHAAAAIMPGDLLAGHAEDPRARHCFTCHSWTQSPVPEPCLSCHREIQAAQAGGAGYHAKLGDSCLKCHDEHAGAAASLPKLDAAFDHSQTRFPLQGRHRDVRCEQCHQGEALRRTGEPAPRSGPDVAPRVGSGQAPRPSSGQAAGDSARKFHYIGLQFDSCMACHRDPHVLAGNDQCARCHNEQGWKAPNLLFAHDRQGQFRIDGIHSALSCATCHKNEAGRTRYSPLARTCEGCHADIVAILAGNAPGQALRPDPHARRVNCRSCHVPEVHAPTPDQYAQKCQDCHRQMREGGNLSGWWASMNARQDLAQKALAELQSQGSPKAAELAGQIQRAQVVGFHNIRSAPSLWDDLLRAAGKTPPDSGRARTGRSREGDD